MDFRTDIGYRKETLKKLLHSVLKNEDLIVQALQADFKKPAFETVLTEIYFVKSDIENAIKNIRRQARPKRVLPSILNFPSTDYIYSEPYGKVLIIAPWNYPFQLAMCPLIAAVAAGNSVVLKPSELTPNTTSILSIIIAETFDPVHVEVFQGGPEVGHKLLQQRWDYIFFTGSVSVGKIVAKAAAEHLTPVTLELGGKNPCIIDDTANLPLAAKRIVWGKFLNAGQTCIAPDFLLVHDRIIEPFTKMLISEIKNVYGENPKQSSDFARIVNLKNTNRLAGLLQGQQIIFGGEFDLDSNYVAPTLIASPNPDSAIMSEEIFGPLLPILPWNDESDLTSIIGRYEKPLALYIFSDDTAFAKKMISDYPFGGGCINDTMIHFGNNRLPFGGIGHSGIGAYHGQNSFDTFSHKKAIVKKANWLDIPLRYAPYNGKLAILRKLLKWF